MKEQYLVQYVKENFHVKLANKMRMKFFISICIKVLTTKICRPTKGQIYLYTYKRLHATGNWVSVACM
jgi:hypothetical protein